MTDLAERLAAVQKIATEMRADGEIQEPHVVFEASGPTGQALVVMPMGDYTKHEMGGAIKMAAEALGWDWYAVVSEGWSVTSTANPDAIKQVVGGTAISDLPPDDKQEILMVLVVKRDETSSVAVARINDDQSVGAFETMDKGTAKSHFIVGW